VSVVFVAGLLVLVTGCTSPSTVANPRANPDPGGYLAGTSLPEPYTMPEVSLTDTAGQRYNLATSPSKPVTLLFFGYTHCPDVCTAVLSDLAITLQRIDQADRDQIQVVFVTTDPARDQEQQIRSYLDRFDPAFIGLTGSLSVIKRAAGQVGVDIEGMEKLPSGGYDIGHSAQVIGFSRAKGVVLWTPGTPIGDLEHDLGLLVDRSQ
jgi:protein SCO1/2